MSAPTSPGVAPQHAFQLLKSQATTPTPPGVRLGPDDECLTKALIQTGETLLIVSGDVPLRITHLMNSTPFLSTILSDTAATMPTNRRRRSGLPGLLFQNWRG